MTWLMYLKVEHPVFVINLLRLSNVVNHFSEMASLNVDEVILGEFRLEYFANPIDGVRIFLGSSSLIFNSLLHLSFRRGFSHSNWFQVEYKILEQKKKFDSWSKISDELYDNARSDEELKAARDAVSKSTPHACCWICCVWSYVDAIKKKQSHM